MTRRSLLAMLAATPLGRLLPKKPPASLLAPTLAPAFDNEVYYVTGDVRPLLRLLIPTRYPATVQWRKNRIYQSPNRHIRGDVLALGGGKCVVVEQRTATQLVVQWLVPPRARRGRDWAFCWGNILVEGRATHVKD